MSSEEQALLRSIIDAPEDDAPRLVFADWLDDNRQGERAEFIRVQCQLARMQRGVAGKGINAHKKMIWREQELLLSRQQGTSTGRPSDNTRSAARYVWAGPVAQLYDSDRRGWTFRRGFVDEIRCTAEEAITHLDAIREWHPIQSVTLTTGPSIEFDGSMSDGVTNIRLFGRKKWSPWKREDSEEVALKRLCEAEWPGITFHLPPVAATASEWFRLPSVIPDFFDTHV